VFTLSVGDPVVGLGRKRGITIKGAARQLREEARQSGVAPFTRESIAAPPPSAKPVYAMSTGLAGSLAGDQRAAQVSAAVIAICDAGAVFGHLRSRCFRF
jgi:hypothetical protein